MAECCDEVVDISFYDKNRELLYNALMEYGYECAKPEGAFYMFVKTPIEDDTAFVDKAKEYRILLTSGVAFGCPGYARISYCLSYEKTKNSLPGFKALAEFYKNEK